MGPAGSRVANVVQSAVLLLCSAWLTWQTTSVVYSLMRARFSSANPAVHSGGETAAAAAAVSARVTVGSLSGGGHSTTEMTVPYPRRTSAAASSNSSSHNNRASRVLLISVGSSVCFTLSLLFSLIGHVVTVSYVGWSNPTADQRMNAKDRNRGRPYRYASLVVQLSGYCSLLLIMIERTRLVLKRSAFALSPRTVRTLRSVIACVVFFIFLAMPAHFFVGSVASAAVAVLPMLTYFVLSFYAIWRLLSAAVSIADSVQSSNHGATLLNAAVRLSLITGIAWFTTLTTGVSFVLVSLDWTTATNLLWYQSYNMDAALNSACLYFTLRASEPLYQVCLGWLHHRVLAWVRRTRKLEDERHAAAGHLHMDSDSPI